MSDIDNEILAADYDTKDIEKRARELWEKEGVYSFERDSKKEVFSVDTPPPYVSAAHLHVGHAMSYSQAEFLVRYKRMCGYNIFYPMGFDDNGLPTERFVEKKYGIKPGSMHRGEFIELCLKETMEGAKGYEELWRDLGLSVDWSLSYSTINSRCQKTAQKSFIELFHKGVTVRCSDPILWCTQCGTSLSQADIESLERKGKIHDISFGSPHGDDLIISTTRPELIPACVALYFNPEDERYAHLKGKKATVPLFGYEVPILTDTSVDREFGTGLMMVCTFGDIEDVEKWRRDKLDTRVVFTPNGKLNNLGGKFEGLNIPDARKQVLDALKESGSLRGTKALKQMLGAHERCDTPVEFQISPQWFINVLDHKEDFLKRGEELGWFPPFMTARYKDWVEGLKWNWNISRQRFYGVPFPVWYCEEHRHVILPDISDLPVDPLEDKPPVDKCPDCGSENIIPEEDVMDTWMTSSLTPLVNSMWAEEGETLSEIYPMSLRVQAFEIIRTWLFYTVVKSHFHTDTLPWKNVMISGWGLNENGKKISKRDLEKHVDADGYNKYDPKLVIERYGADSLRFWSASANLGSDLKYNEKQIKQGRRLMVKLWNASRFILSYLPEGDLGRIVNGSLPVSKRSMVDKWIISKSEEAIERATEAFERYEYSKAIISIEQFFWNDFCDNYLEFIKDRFWAPKEYPEHLRESALFTMIEMVETVLTLYAPFVPFITEELYQKIFRKYKTEASIHITPWPKVLEKTQVSDDMGFFMEFIKSVRRLRTEKKIKQTKRFSKVEVEVSEGEKKESLKRIWVELKAAVRTDEFVFGAGDWESESLTGIKLSVVEKEQKLAAS